MSGTIATALVLVVSPSLNVDGRKACSTRGQLFDGKLDGRSVVKRSPTPFCAAARVLLAEGVDQAARFVMRHDGSPHDALRSTVGAAAKLTVADSGTGKPVFVPWVDLRETWSPTARSGPPMRETESPAVQGTLRVGKRTGDRTVTAFFDDAFRHSAALRLTRSWRRPPCAALSAGQSGWPSEAPPSGIYRDIAELRERAAEEDRYDREEAR